MFASSPLLVSNHCTPFSNPTPLPSPVHSSDLPSSWTTVPTRATTLSSAESSWFSPSPLRHKPTRTTPASMLNHPQTSSPTETRTTVCLSELEPGHSVPIMSSPPKPKTTTMTPPSSSKKSYYAERYATTVSSPLHRLCSASTSEAARAQRRGRFLDRVKRDRESEKFERRGEHLMLSDHLAEQKRWDEAMRAYANGLEAGEEEDVMRDDDSKLLPDNSDIYTLEEYVSQEKEIESALMEHMSYVQHLQSASRDGNPLPSDSNFSFWGDDDEYESIFMNFTGQVDPCQDMDMSKD